MLGFGAILYGVATDIYSLEFYIEKPGLSTGIDDWFYILSALFFGAGVSCLYYYYRKLVTRNIIIHGLIVGTSLAAFIWIIQIDPYLSMNHSYDNFINFFVYPLALVVCGFFASIYLMTNLGDVWTYRFIFLAILSYSIGQLLFSQVFLWQQTVSHAVITSNRLIFWSDAADTVALLLRTFC